MASPTPQFWQMNLEKMACMQRNSCGERVLGFVQQQESWATARVYKFKKKRCMLSPQ